MTDPEGLFDVGDEDNSGLNRLLEDGKFILRQQASAHELANLFRAGKGADQLIGNPELLKRLTDSYKADLSGCRTITERFAVFTDERYLPYVNSLDLGKTDEAVNHSKIDALDREYYELLESLIDAGHITDELPRADVPRIITISDYANDIMTVDGTAYAFGSRSRKLAYFDFEGQVIQIYKRLDFLAADTVFCAYYDKMTGDEGAAKKYLEKHIDEKDPRILPLQTVYYASAKAVKA